MPDENSTRGGLAKKALAPLSGLLLASSFLSRLPAPGLVDWEDKRVWSWSFAFYPLCGYGLGAFAALPLLLLIPLPYFDSLPMLSAVFYLALLEWATRFLHFDGFCDCCDAFSAMTLSPERRLEIMKDPHVGSSAVGGGVLLLICKAVVLYMIAYKGVLVYNALLLSFALLVAIPALARLTMLTLAACGDYPREKGTAAKIVGKVPLPALAFAFAVGLGPAALLLGTKAIIPPVLLCVVCAWYWRSKAKEKIGGVTGDVLGACSETAELAAAAGFLLSLEAHLF